MIIQKKNSLASLHNIPPSTTQLFSSYNVIAIASYIKEQTIGNNNTSTKKFSQLQLVVLL